MGPGALGGGPEGEHTPNGLVETRYLEVTPQARRLPVAIVLIVDQAHVARVQTAFSDSPLRFLITQVLLHRYPRSVRPDAPTQPGGESFAGGEPGGMKMRPFAPGAMPYGSGSSLMPPSMMMKGRGMAPLGGSSGFRPPTMPRPGGRMGGMPIGATGYPGSAPPLGMPGAMYGASSAPVEADEQEANVELVLYGIVTLYERYPQRPASALPVIEAPPAEGQPPAEAPKQ
jgi:hypothetical protein